MKEPDEKPSDQTGEQTTAKIKRYGNLLET